MRPLSSCSRARSFASVGNTTTPPLEDYRYSWDSIYNYSRLYKSIDRPLGRSLRGAGGAGGGGSPPGLLALRLRKLALGRSRELELLRSHPKDERGSVREIGLWGRMCPTLHFLELSPTLWWELPRCQGCSFSGPFWDPERCRKWIPKWTRKGPKTDPQTGT